MTIEEYFAEKEAGVMNLANEAKSMIESGCASSVTKCSECSYDACVGTVPTAECDSDFPATTECLDCGGNAGSNASFKDASYRFPPGTKMDATNERFVCSSTSIDAKMDKNFDNDKDLAW